MEKVIEVQNLRKVYGLAKGRELAAVKDVSFDVAQGEIFGILGPNGAGKTTTLEILECLKPQTSGTVAVLGFDNLRSAGEIKKRIGVQLQASDYLPYLSLGELLDLFASLYPAQAKGLRHQNTAELLQLVGLEDKVHEQVKNLSGGQKQRFTIATSLVNKPDILFLDEPTTGLDPAARRSLWQLIKKINAEGITIVMTTHYMEEAEFLCNRVAIMDSGKILEIDEPKKLIDDLSHSTQVSFFTASDFDENIFKQMPEVIKIYSQSPKTILEIKSLDHISSIVESLKNNRIAFSGFTVKTATLEDVYLRLTGKEFEE